MTLRYSADTSAFLGAWHRRLPRDIVPGFWLRLSDLIQRGELGCNEEVKREIDKKDDDVKAWLAEQTGCVHQTTSNVVKHVQTIMARFPKLVSIDGTRSSCDPFVIAFALEHGLTVITEEVSAPSRCKIPDVCSELDIPCINVYAFVRAEGWRF